LQIKGDLWEKISVTKEITEIGPKEIQIKIKIVLTEEPLSPEKSRGRALGAGVNSDGDPT
jgi:hypothetical protein